MPEPISTMNDVKTICAARLGRPIGQSGSDITDSQILQWGNYGLYQTVKLTALLTKTLQITSTGAYSYPLLASATDIIGIDYVTLNENGPDLNGRDMKYILRTYTTSWKTAGSPVDFVIDDKLFTNIIFVPHSDTTTDIYYIHYVYRPVYHADLTTTFTIPYEYCIPVLEWVWWNVAIVAKRKAETELLAMGRIAPAFMSAIELANKGTNLSNNIDKTIISPQRKYDVYNI